MFGGIPNRELGELEQYWEAFPALRDALFTQTSSKYVALKCNDVKETITHHSDVTTFVETYEEALEDFDDFLKTELIEQMQTLNISQEEERLSQELFGRLENIALIDKYEAYQLLDDAWLAIAGDLEMIQTEGVEACTQVDPNMVTKKKKGKDTEVQEGWLGHILPFELVQKSYLPFELEDLKNKENRLLEIGSAFETILESFSEEEKEAESVKESNDAFVNAVVLKEAKEIKKRGGFDAESYEAKILQVEELINEEKHLKKEVKAETEALHLLTKETIENLSSEQVTELLELKWITPLVKALHTLPINMVNELTTQLQTLSEKYATTYADVADEIETTEKELASLIDELTGNEFDMLGLDAFKSLLRGDEDDAKK